MSSQLENEEFYVLVNHIADSLFLKLKLEKYPEMGKKFLKEEKTNLNYFI